MVAKRYQIRRGHILWIFVIAFVAAMAVFADAPEAVFVQSEDGLATLRGHAPRSFGSISIRSEAEGAWLAPKAGMGLVYVLEPARTFLPQPLEFSIRINAEDYPRAPTLGWWNAESGAWAPITSEFDSRTQTVRANIYVLAPWTVLLYADSCDDCTGGS